MYPAQNIIISLVSSQSGSTTYPGDVVVLVNDPDSPIMRISDRGDKHITLVKSDRRSRDERQQEGERRKNAEEEVRDGVRELHVHDWCG